MKTYHSVDTTHTLEIILSQVSQPNCLKKVLLPPLLTPINTYGNISLLTNSATKAPRLIPRSKMRQRIPQVIKLALPPQLLRHVVLQPKSLWNLHFNTHLATNIFEQLVLSRIDFLCLLHRTVVQPENNVAVITIVGEVRPRDGYGFVGVCIEDCEGAGCVEANTFDFGGVDSGFSYDAADAFADTVPDVCSGLFVVSILRLPELDVLRGESFDVARLVDDASSSRASSHVYANVVVLLPQLLASVNRKKKRCKVMVTGERYWGVAYQDMNRPVHRKQKKFLGYEDLKKNSNARFPCRTNRRREKIPIL